MTYRYIDASDENNAHALPDVEIFHSREYLTDGEQPPEWFEDHGWYFAFGNVGCLWDGDPEGHYETEDGAMEAAREAAGYCEHGHDLDNHHPCIDCATVRGDAMADQLRDGDL